MLDKNKMTKGGVASATTPHLAHVATLANAKCGGNIGGGCVPLGLPQPLLLEEKKFLLAVERGDIPNVRRILQKAHRRQHININCMDPLGRRALTLAIDNENLEMVELLVIMGVETKDALLHAINAEFVEAVELLLEHEEIIHKEGEPYSWQKVDINTAMYPPDVTPLMLAAHKNNFEILKILLDRGAAVPVPHDIRCGCDECVRLSSEDSLRHSLSRVNIYRALTSPSLISLTSSDPILTAFQLSWELRNLALTEQECKVEYMELRRQCQKFAVDLLDQTRTSNELAILLNYDPELPTYEPGDRMALTRLKQAICYKQKQFVAHSNIQQLLSAIWYDGLPGFRRMGLISKASCIAKVAVMFPLYCLIYMFAPNCKTGLLMRKPFMKFLIHASSYLFFLFILILVSQRAEDEAIRIFGTSTMKLKLEEELRRQRGNGPTKLEMLVVFYVFGFIWEEIQEIYTIGMKSYLRNMWNFIDFLRNSLYVSVMCLRIFAYIQQATEIAHDPNQAYVPREKWDDFDPQLIAEGLFAAANVFSALKLVHLFSINPHLGPLQISLGRMVIDIVKFFFIYTLVLFAFACGLNELLWYFADLEKEKCYSLGDGIADWTGNGDSCSKWRRFGNLFESSQSLFWASFGMVGLSDFELTGIKTYTRFWGMLMFGSYCVINVIVLLNLLIAMMSNSYAMIEQHSDIEWKFARTKLWMSYFEDSATLPPPFNIMPSVKWIIRVFRKSSKDIDRKRSKKRHEKNPDSKYDNMMRSLVWRYVVNQHRKFEDNPVTEDDINEVKSEISTMRYEMLEIFASSGMDVSAANRKEKPCRARRAKVWERRLMKGFQVGPVNTVHENDDILSDVNGDGDMNEIKVEKMPSKNASETPIERFRRIAHTVVAQSSSHKWTLVLRGVTKNSQIGRSFNRQSQRNLRNLNQAMAEARKLVLLDPSRTGRESPASIEFEDERTNTLLGLLNDISHELDSGHMRNPHDREKILQAKQQLLNANSKAQVDQIAKQPIFQKTTSKFVNNQELLANKQRSKTMSDMEKVNPNKEINKSKLKKEKSLDKPELALSARKLNEQQMTGTSKPAVTAPKKAAPTIPQTATAASTHTPFSVELGGAGRHPSYRKIVPKPQPVPGNAFDMTFIDLDNSEDHEFNSADDVSEISSIGGAHASRERSAQPQPPPPKYTATASKQTSKPGAYTGKWL